MGNKRKLTPKQAAFVREYQKDLNATQAAIRAGYSEKSAEVQGYQLLQKTIVKDAVGHRLEIVSEKANNTTQRILEELMRIAFFDIRDIMSWTDTGVAFIDSTKINENTARAISEVNETITAAGGSRRVKMHDKIKALELLGKYAGMFKEQVEVTNKTTHELIVEQIESQKKLVK
jgi:phage terminase small subunit